VKKTLFSVTCCETSTWGKNAFSAAHIKGVPVLESLQEAGELCARGLEYVIGNGKKVRFWLDIWVGECPFRILFPHIFIWVGLQQQNTVSGTTQELAGGD
jgi:hypothetical protein